ncbi:hypothetical protein [Paenibacillus campi]|uniref:hypothetical protein n=1 Tax=Paenibacillus campi TaxID=3106031 RepID=UPI002B000891|nr:hypothetical protein [Paenibacillus sp. SGZ-1009]
MNFNIKTRHTTATNASITTGDNKAPQPLHTTRRFVRSGIMALTLGVVLASVGGLWFTSPYASAAATGSDSATSAKAAQQPATVTSGASTTKTTTSGTGVVQTQTQVYEGKHFRFYYPPAWKTGIKAAIYHPPGMDSSEVVDFSYNGFSVLSLMAIPRAVWNAQLPDEVPYGERIAANSNYIYAINLPQDSVYDPASKEYPPFHKRVLTTDQVKLMFQGK